jgi:hypothetical protein
MIEKTSMDMRHTIKTPKKLKFSEKSIDKVIVAKETH